MTTTPPRLIYIAGPYRAATTWQREQNSKGRSIVGVAVAKAGAYPVIPHSITAHFDAAHLTSEASDDLWLPGTLELMRRCDGVLLLPGWKESKGSCAEHAEAAARGIPVEEWHTIDIRKEQAVARLLQQIENGPARADVVRASKHIEAVPLPPAVPPPPVVDAHTLRIEAMHAELLAVHSELGEASQVVFDLTDKLAKLEAEQIRERKEHYKQLAELREHADTFSIQVEELHKRVRRFKEKFNGVRL
jgi:hypothetical protein